MCRVASPRPTCLRTETWASSHHASIKHHQTTPCSHNFPMSTSSTYPPRTILPRRPRPLRHPPTFLLLLRITSATSNKTTTRLLPCSRTHKLATAWARQTAGPCRVARVQVPRRHALVVKGCSRGHHVRCLAMLTSCSSSSSRTCSRDKSMSFQVCRVSRCRAFPKCMEICLAICLAIVLRSGRAWDPRVSWTWHTPIRSRISTM
mmetsp:Transcript_88818/g.129880  ORF Transcript_88818/g.129880 Transcript_88818/m.129880 type:complete len:205 (+) Transcript_88818:454-1068(+)